MTVPPTVGRKLSEGDGGAESNDELQEGDYALLDEEEGQRYLADETPVMSFTPNGITYQGKSDQTRRKGHTWACSDGGMRWL